MTYSYIYCIYLFTLKNAHLSSNSYNFRMQPNIPMKFTVYVAWILLCKHCKFGEKNYYNSGDIEFFLGDYFFLARPVDCKRQSHSAPSSLARTDAVAVAVSRRSSAPARLANCSLRVTSAGGRRCHSSSWRRTLVHEHIARHTWLSGVPLYPAHTHTHTTCCSNKECIMSRFSLVSSVH